MLLEPELSETKVAEALQRVIDGECAAPESITCDNGSDFYDPIDKRALLWSDLHLSIAWGTQSPLGSEEDRGLCNLNNIPRDLFPFYAAQ